MTKKEHYLFQILLLLGFSSSIIFAGWWFQPQHIAQNFSGLLHIFDYVLFFALSYIVWYQIVNELFYWYNANHMRKIEPVKPEEGLSVAFLTAFVPQNEPYDVLERNLEAMVAVDYPHDTWLLDEGNDPIAKAICKKYGVKHFSRKGIEKYNMPDGEFKAKTKGGNYNAWFDQHGLKYHIVAQVDVDFIPKKNFLTDTLGYFRDRNVAFVGTPQIYGNQDASWIARGAAEQAFSFYGPMQKGFNYTNMSLFIGANHVFRSIAHHEINGYAGHIVEDHLTGMNLFKRKWKGVYVPKILAVGEGPATWETYFNQQMRWAYGLFHILFNHSPKIYPHLRKHHLLNYMVLQQYYFYGILQAAAIGLLTLYYVYGINATDMKLVPMLTMYSILLSIQFLISTWLQRFFVNPKKESGLHLRAKLLNIAVWPIYLLAFISVIFGKKITYKVTEKGAFTYRPPHISLFLPHLVLGLISSCGLYIAFKTHHTAPHLIFFGLLHTVAMLGLFGHVVLENLYVYLRTTEPRQLFKFAQ
jgi:cellulose synthase/poly-beta-1,6-N-acetylglucosamine synthase-like glycosyltransferase